MGKHQIRVRDLCKKGIHYEVLKDFQKSIFSDVYRLAAKSVKRIVQDNERYKCVGWSRKNIQDNQIEIANVISFIGQRGTGKTSCLLSFSKALEQHGSTECSSIYKSNDDMENIKFFSLSCIDAAILENAEDIFVLVLANMLKRIEKGDEGSRLEENYQKQDIIKDLEKVYLDFKNLKENDLKDPEWMYSIYEHLKNFSSTQRIQENFSILVKKYLKYLSEQECNDKKNPYLVISIDDIDMSYYNLSSYNFKKEFNPKSYAIMNTIQKYLSIPGVIVLVSYNDENLHQQCQRFFAKSNEINYITEKERKLAFNESTKLANQFMEKVFSPIYRIYMPSWKKDDLKESRLEVLLEENGDAVPLFSRYHGNNKINLSTKEFVLALYAIRTGIYYNPMGRKRHFLEPDSLRELSNILNLLIEQECIIDQQENECCDYMHCIKRLQNDIYFRFIEEKLTNLTELKEFQRWLELPIDRRARTIVQEMKDIVEPLGKATKDQIAKLEIEKQRILKSENLRFQDLQKIEEALFELKHQENAQYGFSELVHAIYHMTREKNNEQKYLYSKEFVASILHSFSVQLSKCYNEYRNAKKICNNDIEKIRKDVNYQVLKNIIGNSILGHWAEYLLPEVFIGTKKGVTDDLSSSGISTMHIPIAYINNNNFQYIFAIERCKSEKNNENIKAAVFMFFMYSNLLDLENNVVVLTELEQKIYFTIMLKQEIDFDMTAFMKYGFLYEESLAKVRELLLDALEKSELDIHIKEVFKKEIDVCLDDLEEEYHEWDKNYGNMLIPIYNFDLAYNMIKHLYQKGKRENIEVVDISKQGVFWQLYNDLINNFKDYFKNVDDYYCIQEKEKRFRECFEENPFVKQVIYWGNEDRRDGYVSKLIERNVYAMIANTLDNEKNNVSGDDVTI